MGMKTGVGLLGLAAGMAFLVLLLSSTLPIRWDLKSIAPNLPQIAGASPPYQQDIVFVTADESWQNLHVARYGLDFLTFPDARHVWLVFRDGVGNGRALADYAIDQMGRFYANDPHGEWRLLAAPPARLLRIAQRGTVLLSSPALFEPLVQRWPLVAGRPVLEQETRTNSFLVKPQLHLSVPSFLRLWWFLSILLMSLAAVVAHIAGQNRGFSETWLAGCFVIPLWLAVHTFMVYLLGWVTEHAITMALGVQTLLALAALLYLLRHPDPFVKSVRAVTGVRPAVIVPVIVLVLAVSSFSVLRLDFDGDLFTHWIPSARFHYLLGHHDLAALLHRYGGAHEATYPPGFPIFLSTLMWIADVSRDSSFRLEYETHLAIFLYRTGLLALHLSFLFAAAVFFKRIGGQERGSGWLAPTLAIPLILPLFFGKPVSSEIYLVPILGFSIIAFAYGGWSSKPGYVRAGLALSVFGLFLKNDAMLSLPFILLPWYLVSWAGRRPLTLMQLSKDVLVVLFCLVPWLVWRMDLSGLNIDTNFMFDKLTPLGLANGFHQIVPLAQNALKIVLDNGFWLVLFAALPATAVYQFMSRRRRFALIIPMAIWCYAAGLNLIYLFSRSDAVLHQNTSYDRLLMIAVLSGMIYCGRELLVRPPQVSEA